MASQPESLLAKPHGTDASSLTYEPFFGLREKPFSLSPDPRFFFRTISHTAAFSDLLAGIKRREGILALTGEVGTGKTTICRTVLESLDRRTFAAFVRGSVLTPEDLLTTLLVDFGIVSAHEVQGGRLRGATRTELSYPLNEFLLSLEALQAFAVLVIDEAQLLPPSLIEEVRYLSELEGDHRLLQLILVGQPELQERFAQADMRHLTQRLSVRCELEPLSRTELARYIAHRLAIAGSTTVSFSDRSIDLVSAASGGIPRVANLLCDRALRRAARAQTTTVAQEHVVGAADDLKIPPLRFVSPLWERPSAAVTSPANDESESSRFPSGTNPTRTAAEWAFLLAPDLDAAPRRTRSLQIAASAIGVIALSLVGLWHWSGPEAEAPTPQPAALVSENVSVPPVAVPSSPPSLGQENVPSPQESGPSPEVSRAAMPEAVAPSEPTATVQVPRFLVQMATFRSATRAAESVEQFRAAGHEATGVAVSLQDNSRAFAVLLGPYTDRGAAEGAMALAQQVPGYGAGRIVEIRPPQ